MSDNVVRLKLSPWAMKKWFTQEQWFSDRYKIVYYWYYHDGTPAGREASGSVKGYHAYYKASGDKSWGYHVQHNEKPFQSLKDARAACLEHLRRFGTHPQMGEKI